MLAAITLTTWLDVIAMKTDAAKEISFDDEHQCGEAKDLFFTPSLRCLHLKIEFLKKAQDFKFWGRNGSKQRVIAMDTLHKYCEESFGLTGNDDKLFEKMWLEIHNLVLQSKPILPIPKTVREKLATAVNRATFGLYDGIENVSPKARPIHIKVKRTRPIFDELEILCQESLREYESNEWSRMEKFKEYSFYLRKLRKRIYEGVNVVTDTMHYDFDVSKFIEEFDDMMTPEEVEIWNQKYSDTKNFAEELLGSSMEDLCPDFVVSYKDALANALDDDDKSEEILEERFPIPNPKEIETPVPLVQRIFDAAKAQENLLDNLPEVPASDDAFDDDPISEERDIEARLLRLKRFRKTWCSEQPPGETEPGDMTPAVVAKPSVPKRKSEIVDVSLSSSSKLDVKNFNDWYLEKIGAKSNSSPADLNVQVKTTKVVHEQDEVPIPAVPDVVEATEENHATQVMSLFTPNAGNLFEGPASLHSILNMETLVVLLFTILKLIQFAPPKLSYVPAVFPTQPQPYTDPVTPVPSSARGSLLTPMQRVLTRTCRWQVVLCDMARENLSELRDAVWRKVRGKKVALGLRIVKVGEMLLS